MNYDQCCGPIGSIMWNIYIQVYCKDQANVGKSTIKMTQMKVKYTSPMDPSSSWVLEWNAS